MTRTPSTAVWKVKKPLSGYKIERYPEAGICLASLLIVHVKFQHRIVGTCRYMFCLTNVMVYLKCR